MLLFLYCIMVTVEVVEKEIVRVHPRVHERHPEISDDDVRTAWYGAVVSIARVQKYPVQYVAIGFDGKGRAIEMVAIRDAPLLWTIFHAMTPPSQKTYRELQVRI